MAETLAIQLKDAPLASFSPEEMLAFLTTNGKIDLRDVEDDMRKARKEQILKQHPYKIYQGSDGRWRTHIPDESKKEGRRLIVKSSLNDLETAVCEHYDSQKKSCTKETCTLEQLYPKWIEYKALHVLDTTVIRVKKDWRRYYQDSPIIKKPIRQLKKLELDTWVHEMIRKFNMDDHQYGNFSLIIRQMLTFAVDCEIVDSNEFLKVNVDKKRVLAPSRKKADHTQVFNKTEEQKVIEHAWESFEKDEFSIKDNYHITINILNSCAIAYSAIIGVLIMIFVIRLLKNLSENIKISGNRINNAFCFVKVKYFKINN